MTYVFGSILAVTPADLWASLGTAGLTGASLPLWGRWASASFDRESARAGGLPVQHDDLWLLTLIALAVVVAVKVVGIVLLSAFLVVPAASARLLSRRFAGMTLLATGLGAATALVGLVASYFLDLPSGAAIILVQCLVFAAAYGLRRTKTPVAV
jgi:zinc transport system permease protein